MIRNYCGAVAFAIFTVLFTTSLGWCRVPQEDVGVLADSKIKKNRFKKGIINQIKKSLPEDLRKCSIIVTNIKLLRAEDDFNLAEEWTVDICQQEKEYFVETLNWPKEWYHFEVKTKEARFKQEKETLRNTLDWVDDEAYTRGFYYLEDVLSDAEFKKWIEEDKNTEVKRIEYKIGNQTYERYIRVKKKE